jgi:hypothetical protein
MLRRNQNIDDLNKKCELLEDLGFTINHRDCDVSFETIKYEWKDFDFSAVAPDVNSILYSALNHVYKLGVAQGRELNQRKLREALGMEE